MSKKPDWISDTARIHDPTGLHARPAVKLTKLAKQFDERVELRVDGQESWINAKSPNAVIKLKAAHGEPLHVRAAGTDARNCVQQLIALINRDFSD